MGPCSGERLLKSGEEGHDNADAVASVEGGAPKEVGVGGFCKEAGGHLYLTRVAEGLGAPHKCSWKLLENPPAIKGAFRTRDQHPV